MTNRDLIMVKLIQLSDKDFANLMDENISTLMGDELCKVCMAKHGGNCPNESGEWEGCRFDMVAWLRSIIGTDELTVVAAS